MRCWRFLCIVKDDAVLFSDLGHLVVGGRGLADKDQAKGERYAEPCPPNMVAEGRGLMEKVEIDTGTHEVSWAGLQ